MIAVPAKVLPPAARISYPSGATFTFHKVSEPLHGNLPMFVVGAAA